MSTTTNGHRSDDLRDEALQRALVHAPDHTVAPNWRLRKAILDHAHDAVMPLAAREAPEPMRPWWQRLLGIGGGQEGAGRMPWNAAFATVLVGVLIAVLWQREPVPSPRADGDALVRAPAQRSEPPAAPSPPPAVPAPAPALAPPATERALLSSQDIPGGPAPAPQAAAEPTPVPAPAQVARTPLSAERPVLAPAPSELARRQADEAALSASAGAAAKEARRKEVTAPGGQAASPPGVATPAAPTGLPQPPSFSALSQWSRLTITQRGGASRSLSRSEAQDLNALLGSAAISAVGAQPLAGAPEWRVTLERSNGDVMATFELGRSQVRWREGRGAVATGTPSPGSVAALREALQSAVEQPAQPAPPPQLRLKPVPQQPAAPEAAPPVEPPR
ncbi:MULTISPECIES: hypothetical protein [unclassified Variovorax]|uniref:hypothetical protein n=1 Tax=unclassified Variovorax TaxID=663243 RepID=UPI00076C5BEA|nr:MULTISPECIES: hypothetical protein [unclassified Variovorax]KWT72294.1 hypothetical protein APY03_6319 [Variovorax sp. WDL1]PNG53241.1 hypothetical protein CHC06_04587 [Variovorax sp. B2]PNG53813.1 hypothetical protein CHC07_03634 [Variovorax sp. B4]VTV11271.1 hypothetical protein WDL1CHR_02148 [Variovorax sp. WDL1]